MNATHEHCTVSTAAGPVAAELDLTVQGVFEFLERKGQSVSPQGLQVMLHGQVPTGKCLPACPGCAMVSVCMSCVPWINTKIAATLARMSACAVYNSTLLVMTVVIESA